MAEPVAPAPAGMPLLASKLAMPRLPARVVPRPRLFAMLDTGVRGPVTLVAAPAGAGKTMLLGSWIASARPPGRVAWLSLDPADNDPARFWAYVLAAVHDAGVALPRQVADEPLVSLVMSCLAALDEPVVLVLDDFHELTDPVVLEGVGFLLRHAPEQLRLVLSTRADPTLPLHRLLVGGGLTQLRIADLAFTVAEVAELLADYDYCSKLSGDDLALLRERTEGWAAGLRLVALSLEHQPDPHRFVAEFAGDDRCVAGYLIAEVLDRQPHELRGFLLRTCVVDALNGELADALTGRHDGEWTLARLERAGAFVAALGARRGWYRYHPLFAELLRSELRHEAPDGVAELRRRAARWYAAHGAPVDAVTQAVAAKDWHAAADLVAEHGLRSTLRDQSGVFRDLLDRVPADLLRTDPALTLLNAAERIASHDEDQVDAWLRLATEQERRLSSDDQRRRFRLVLLICRSVRAMRAGDHDEVLAVGRQALALRDHDGGGPADDARAEAVTVVLAHLGAAELVTGDLDAAEAHLEEAHTRAVHAGLDAHQVDCLSQLAVLHALRGRLTDASRVGRAAVQLAEQQVGSTAGRPAGGHLALAWVHHQRDDPATAGRCLERAAAASQAAPTRPLAAIVGIVEARLRQAGGDLAGALEALHAVREPPESLGRLLAVAEAEVWIAVGDLASARGVLEAVDGGHRPSAWRAVALARLALAEGDPAAATTTLAPLLQGTAPAVHAGALVDAWLLDALAGQALDDPDRAAASLGRAVELAEPEGSRRAFLDGGPEVRVLLARHRHRIASSWSFLDELLQDPVGRARVAVAALPVMIEPLSERERAVLRYLPSMLSYGEIASELYVSTNTIKSHTRNIYRKLGAGGRRDAVGRARQLRLLRS
jgi:LuxR family transcriptional regulator, maltose regulon positive regulatory protein